MEDKYERIVLENIEKFGWHAAAIFDGLPSPFVYTVGLEATLNHPELIMFGLDPKLMHRCLSGMVHEIKTGRAFDQQARYTGIIEALAVECRPVSTTWLTEYLGYAMWHRRYCGKTGTLRVMQVVWPGKDGLFPWEQGCAPVVMDRQPRLDLQKPVDA